MNIKYALLVIMLILVAASAVKSSMRSLSAEADKEHKTDEKGKASDEKREAEEVWFFKRPNL